LTVDNRKKTPKAILMGVQLPGISDEEFQGSLAETARLAHTLGFQVLGNVSQKRKAFIKGTLIGEGKLKELARITGGSGLVATQVPSITRKHPNLSADDEVEAEEIDRVEVEADESSDSIGISERADIVVVDAELTPIQQRNLNSATGVEILDRTGLIIEIFHRHAKTREARLQVEIARLKYLAPRLRFSRAGQGDRQGGGAGAGAKGLGETAHELDKRRIRDRIAEINRELADIHGSQKGRRERRSEQLKVALVGYTNAGKSSLMRALTGSEVLVEDKLFATLDTTIRLMSPESNPRVLISDTVGFIRKLPHDLVASFRSTLDEAADASLLLYVVDASDANFREQLGVTREVLGELDLGDAASMIVLNKCDCVSKDEIAALLREFPGSYAMSTRNSDEVAGLRQKIIAHFEKDMVEHTFVVPYRQGEILGRIHDSMRVLDKVSDEEGVHIRVIAYPAAIAAIAGMLGVKV
jgi:GTP-binding protein HflX